MVHAILRARFQVFVVLHFYKLFFSFLSGCGISLRHATRTNTDCSWCLF